MTPREVQVAKLICQGLDNERIARNLRIKPGTIKTHLRNIYRRVRVKSKLTMLLMFLHDVNNSSANSAAASPAISITEIEKSA
jgi:DNA-binding CsgD family transcriptional regulator